MTPSRLAVHLLTLALLLGLAPAAGAQTPPEEGVALTIYNQGFGVVRDRRVVTLRAGEDVVRFTDVAARIDPTSVHFVSLTDPDTHVLEQNYEYDLVSADKLLAKYVDQPLTVTTADGSRYAGRLLSFSGDALVVAETGATGGVVIVQRADHVKDIQLGALPEGLITRPTLVWKLAGATAGEHLVEVAYHSEGIDWEADYTAVLDADDTHTELHGWVTIDNRCGATYADARLKLVAGDVHRAKEERAPEMDRRMVAMAAEAKTGFEEKAFFEYHLYTLQRPTTVADNQTKQIELLSANGVPVEKVLLFQAAGRRYFGRAITDSRFGAETVEGKVEVRLRLVNSADNHMGMPLPRGKVRVFKRDPADGTMEFIGEDRIDHTPRDEEIELYVGDAFDVVGERTRTDFRVDEGRQIMSESFAVEIRNHKTDPVDVLVREVLYRAANWSIPEASHSWEKIDARTVDFPVTIPADGEVKVTYTVRYTW